MSRDTRASCAQASSERGVAAVEFAMVAPVLVLLLAGMIYFGLALLSKIVITNAANASVRMCVLRQAGNAGPGAYADCARSQLTSMLNVQGFQNLCDGGVSQVDVQAIRIDSGPLTATRQGMNMMQLSLTCGRKINPLTRSEESIIGMRITTAMPFVTNP